MKEHKAFSIVLLAVTLLMMTAESTLSKRPVSSLAVALVFFITDSIATC